MGKKESYVEDYLVKKCKKENFLIYKFTSPGTNGVPDRMIITDNNIFFIETKARGETTKKLQNAIIKQMRKEGSVVFVADSRKEIDEILEIYSLKKNLVLKDFIKTVREIKGVNRRNLAKKANINHTTLFRIENGESNMPDIKVLYNLAKALEIPYQILIDLTIKNIKNTKDKPYERHKPSWLPKNC